MLEIKLRSKIFEYISKFGREPNLIVMHPKTWDDIFREVMQISIAHSGEYLNASSNSISNLLYQGIKIVRSSDVSEGFFEM